MTTSPPILLIACGGNSERMGTDKSQLNYHGLPQFQYLQQLLKPVFADIYFSIQKKQESFFSSIPNVIIDSEKYSGHGPVSGLLSCKEKFKGRAILYIGCDYPLLLPEDILKLVSDTTSTCAFYIDQYEPILAFYSVESLNLLEKEFESGNDSLRKFLSDIEAVKVKPDSKERIRSIDTPSDYENAIRKIKLSGRLE